MMRRPTAYDPENLATIKQWFIAGFLIIFMLVTRIDYIPPIPDASWAVIFLIGFYLRNRIGLALIILLALVIDFAQIAARGGHQDFFLAPSYFFIIPAYSALWFAGRSFASKYSENIKGLILFFLSATTGIIICHLVSSGGYYWMSLNIIELNTKDFIFRTLDFLPLALKINLIYLGIAAVIHFLFTQNSNLNFQKTH